MMMMTVHTYDKNLNQHMNYKQIAQIFVACFK